MSAPLRIALEPITAPRARWPWAFWWRFGLGLWYGAGLWLLMAAPEYLAPWVSATAIVGAWWVVWRAFVALLGAR